MASPYASALNKRVRASTATTTQVLPGRAAEMIKNSDGNFVFGVDKWTQALRFLILGTEGATYYSGEVKRTIQNAKVIEQCVAEDGIRLVDLVVNVSDTGRAIKNDPAIFAISVALAQGDKKTQAYAAEMFPKVARIGTHVLHAAEFLNGLTSFRRPVRKAFANVYNGWNPYGLALNLVKYANRDGWTHKDVLRLAHVKPSTLDHDALFGRAAGKDKEGQLTDKRVADFLNAVDLIKSTTDAKVAAALISDYKLPREVVPTELLTQKVIWDALLPHMGLTALVRNLPTMTRVGLIGPMTDGTRTVISKLLDEEQIERSRIHPFAVLTALLTYNGGRSLRGSSMWTPVGNISEALDAMFPLAFKNVNPTGKNILYALDVSPSMNGGVMNGVPGMTPAMASAALLTTLILTEKVYEVVAFTSGGGGWSARAQGLTKFPINKRTSVASALATMQTFRDKWGGTDISLPMEWARKNKVETDGFVIITDNETNAGHYGARHPSEALKSYRQEMGRNARMAVVSMIANQFSVADPRDSGQMDFVGFDSNGPAIMNDFLRGDL